MTSARVGAEPEPAIGAGPRAPRRRSIRRRLTWLTALLSVVGLAAAAVASVVLLHGFLLARGDDQLVSMRERVLAGADLGAERAAGERTVSERLLRRILPAPGVVYLVGPDGGVALALSATGDQVPTLPPQVLADEPSSPRTYEAGGTQLRVVSVPLVGVGISLDDLPGEPVPVTTAVIALDLTPDQETVARLALIEAVAVAVVAAAVAGGTAVALRRGLGPITAMADTARSIAAGDSGARLPMTQASAEAAELAAAVNAALDRRDDAENRLRSFVADASHELRTPLTTVHGWAELYLQGGLAADEVEAAMERIERDSLRMRRIVDDLGLLARLDARLPLRLAQVDLAALVREVVDDARVIDPERPITAQIADGGAGPAGEWRVRCDPERIAQVLRNLVGNAAQHTPSATAVAVRLARAAEDVVVEVADAGPGIPAADLPHVFERFYRASGRPSGEGSGLGLAIVRGIVQAHDGTVAIASAPGEGTTVTVRLPARGPAVGAGQAAPTT